MPRGYGVTRLQHERSQAMMITTPAEFFRIAGFFGTLAA
jgi:hypothetical protein